MPCSGVTYSVVGYERANTRRCGRDFPQAMELIFPPECTSFEEIQDIVCTIMNVYGHLR